MDKKYWLLILWYGASVANMYYSKMVVAHMDFFSYALLQQCASLILGDFVIQFVGCFVLMFLASKRTQKINFDSWLPSIPSTMFYNKFLPIGVFWGGTSLFYTGALQEIPVSYLNIVKTSIPVWTSLICVLYFRERLNMKMLSLIPIIVGIVFCSLHEDGFTWKGLALACLSALSNTTFNIIVQSYNSKKQSKLAVVEPEPIVDTTRYGELHQRTSIAVDVPPAEKLPTVVSEAVVEVDLTPIENHYYTTLVSFLVTGILFLSAKSASQTYYSPGDMSRMDLFMCVVTYYMDILANYSCVSYFKKIQFSIYDVARRLMMIVLSSFIFGTVINLYYSIGITFALSGVLIYNLYDTLVKPSPKEAP